MIRKLFYLIAILFVLLLISRQFVRLPFERLSVFEAVPINVPLFLSLPEDAVKERFDTLDSAISNWLSLFPGLQEDVNFFRKLSTEKAFPIAIAKEAIVTIQKEERAKWGLSLILDIKHSQRVLNEVLALYPHENITKTQFKGKDVFQVNPQQGASTFSIGRCRNLLILGRLPLAVEDVIRQVSEGHSESGFHSLLKGKSARTTPSIYLKSGLFSDYFVDQMQAGTFGRLQQMEKTFDWIKFEVEKKEDQLSIEGVLLTGKENNKLSAFAQQEPQRPDKVFSLIPDDIAMFYYWGFSDFQQYYKAIEVPMIDRFERFIKPWVGEEIIQVVVDPAANSTCLLIKPNDPVMAKQSLDRLLGEAGQLQAYLYNSFQVQQVLEEDLFSFLPFGPVTALRNPHITFLDEYVLFAPSRSALEIWLDQYVVGGTLAAAPDFIQFRQTQSENCHHFLYFNANNWPISSNKSGIKPFLDQYPYLGLSLKSEKEQMKVLASATTALQSDTTGNIVWRVNLSTEALIAPQWVNLGEIGTKVIVAQDAFYNFYVFDREGNLLWQKKLDGPIKLPIESIDYYGDAQYQLLFNTPKNIYLLDKTGRSLSTFPLPLRSPATCGLTLVNFKQDNNPSFFVPCENGQVYGFDKKGQPVPGWNPLFDAGRLSYPMVHFQKSINDYFVALSDTAKIKVFAKNGELQFELIDSTAVFMSRPAYQLGAPSDRIVAVDQKGVAHILNLEGEYFRLSMQVGQNEEVKFAFADVIGNNGKDYVVMSGKSLALYHYASAGFVRAWNYTFQEPQDELFSVSVLNQQKALIGTLDQNRRQVHLLDESGKEWPGFPLSGTRPIQIVDLFDDGRPIVLGANGSSIFGMTLE